jgi:Uma2 family endonuclease
MATERIPFYTIEEYREREYESDTRHEYYAGQVFAMAGGTPAHSEISANVISALKTQLRGRGCRTYTSDLRVNINAYEFYPDVTVVCGEPQFTGRRADALTNPTLIVEVLSSSTEAYDRSEKFDVYSLCSSVQEYILVAQDRARVERYLRQPDGTWNLALAQGLEGLLQLDSIGCELRLAEVYENITFPPLARSRFLRDDEAEETNE